MDDFVHRDRTLRVLLAGTYNAHPAPTAAAIATIERLLARDREVYHHIGKLGSAIQAGLEEIINETSLNAVVARQGSAFCLYFMDHLPEDWHDIALNHDFKFDLEFRRHMVDQGIYFFPAPVKQCSISYSHTAEDIEKTLACVRIALVASRRKGLNASG